MNYQVFWAQDAGDEGYRFYIEVFYPVDGSYADNHYRSEADAYEFENAYRSDAIYQTAAEAEAAGAELLKEWEQVYHSGGNVQSLWNL